MDTLIKRSENALVESLKLSKKTKYNTTRDDGYRVNIRRIRNGKSQKRPITKEILESVKKLRKDGLTFEKIANKLGVNKSRVVRIMRVINNKKYQYKPPIEKIKKFEQRIIDLRKEGNSHYQIRKKLHVSGTIISIIFKENNLLGENHSRKKGRD